MAKSTQTQYPISDTALRTTVQNDGGVGSAESSFGVGVVDSVPSTPFLIGVWKNQSPLREDEMEIMKVTNVPDSQTLEVDRGMKGTTAQSFDDGDLVFMAISSADVFDRIIEEKNKVEEISVNNGDRVTVDPFLKRGKFNLTWQSGSYGMSDIGAVLLFDCQEGQFIEVATGARTIVRGPSGGIVPNEFNVFINEDGTIELENRRGADITVTISTRK